MKIYDRRSSELPAEIEPLETRYLLSAKPIFTTSQLGVPSSLVAVPDFQTRNARANATGSSTPAGITPAQMEGAYGVNNILFGSAAGNGSGQTIAIVDAYDYPTALSDLNAFSSYFGLPTFNGGSGSPSFTKYNQSGSTTSLPGDDTEAKGDDWEVEEALDIEWAHSIAPDASIDLVEATSSSEANLYTAEQSAANLSGVAQVSNSWSGAEYSTEAQSDVMFQHTGVTFLFSTGDSGAYKSGTTKISPNYPATSPDVVAVGGTTLTVGSGNAWSAESAWGAGTNSGLSGYGGGGGGGISGYESLPNFQSGKINGLSTSKRTEPDVSLDANPNTGAPVYDSYDFTSSGTTGTGSWATFGGTSLACPMWAGLMAIANQGRAAANLTALTGYTQTLPDLYNAPAGDFHDITSGNNGYAAGTGYDLATGIGSPIANLLIPALTNPIVTTNPATQTVNVGQDAKFTAAATGSASVQWLVETAGANGFTTLSGATATTLDLGPATLGESGNKYEAIFTNLTGSTTTSVATLTVFPTWLSTTSSATWNATTHVLTVTGATTIIADPGTTGATGEPSIVENGTAAQLTITPATNPADVHIGGITLSNGAGLMVSSADNAYALLKNSNADPNTVFADHQADHNVLTVGISGQMTVPTLAIDSSSKLDLEDNDLIIHDGAPEKTDGSGNVLYDAAGNPLNAGDYPAVQTDLLDGRGATAGSIPTRGIAWNGSSGIVSSVASAADADEGSEVYALGFARNGDIQGLQSALTNWTSGGKSEALGVNDLIIKFTYVGDFNLDGKVDGSDDVTFDNNYKSTDPTSGPQWVYGDCTYGGTVGSQDDLALDDAYLNGTTNAEASYLDLL